MIKNYIFDMDGTLCTSMRFWRDECGELPYDGGEIAWEAVFDKMREHYRDEILLKDGVREFLQNARANGIKMCIATATRRDVAQPLLDKTGIMDFMEFYIDCVEINAFKERPDIFLESARRLGADISECAVFEDSPHAAKTAKAAGFYVVGVFDEITVNDGDLKPFINEYIESWETYKSLIKN